MKDPFFYLVAMAAILFVLASSSPCFLSKNSLATIGANLGSEVKTDAEIRDIFITSADFHPEAPDFCLLQENSLVGAAPPVMVTPQVLGMIMGEAGPEAKKDVIEYEVREGDKLSIIAENFGVSLNTLLWANNLSRTSAIKPGQKIIVLPVSGVLHYVKSGDTISALAKKYKADKEEVVSFNGLSSEDDIFIGDILVIPNGIMPVSPAPVYVADIPVASSYFICPISAPCRVTQGLHWYNAVDFSHGKCGDSIYAAAGGVVQRVKLGWNGGAGNTITILHPNGVVTSYGHILSSLVNPGDQVYQGQAIALMGGNRSAQGLGAGQSTGCHIHFSVRGAKNPFAK